MNPIVMRSRPYADRPATTTRQETTEGPATTLRPSAAIRFGMVVAILGHCFVLPARAEIATGPEVGTKIPDIRALDQYGRIRTFGDLRGPEGLLVLFYRTADW